MNEKSEANNKGSKYGKQSKTSFFLMQKITAPLCNYHKETSCLCIGVVDLQFKKESCQSGE